MAFNGFTDQTNEYFWGASLDNSKSFYEKNKDLYLNYVKHPLQELHRCLVPTVQEIDESICVKPNRCISRAFNDFRYTGKIYPIKNRMHLHFCANVPNEEADTPGLFFEGSFGGWMCGFFVYHSTNAGVMAFREAVLSHSDHFLEIAKKIAEDPRIQIGGEEYKRDHYPNANPLLKPYLNRKRVYLIAKYESNDLYFSSQLPQEILSVWKTVAPMYRFYISAIRK